MSIVLMSRCTLEVRYRGERTAFVEPAAWQRGDAWLHGIDTFAQPITLRRSDCVIP